MKIIHDTTSEIYNSTGSVKDLNFNNSSLRDVRGRDVIIINPCCEGGGDYALAKKIANIALDEGCRVTIVSIDTLEGQDYSVSEKLQSYSLQYDKTHDISQLHNPLFIISPLSIANIDKLKNSLKAMFERFNLLPQDALLIEEMDILIHKDKTLNNYELMLKDIGFHKVTANRLGFDEGAIGYIPTDEKTIGEIKDRFKYELMRLFDSYNMSFSRESSYHLGYISSDCYSTGAQIYIANTLCEIRDDERCANFIMSLRQINMNNIHVVTKAITTIISSRDSDMAIDYSSLFSKATISVIDSDDGSVKVCEEVIGTGIKDVRIILVNRLPKNIYDDFLLLADTGMMSGDQSLSDYLTLKGTLPYYDMQPWKYPLVQSIKKLAGDGLDDYLNKKIVGKVPFIGTLLHSFIKNHEQPIISPEQLAQKKQLDKTLCSNIATPYIKGVIRASLNNC